MTHSSVRSVHRLVTLPAAAVMVLAVPVSGQYGGPAGPTTSLRGGPVGTEVQLSMTSGLAPGARVSIGFGGLSGGYELITRTEVGPDGAVSATATVPSWAERNFVYFFFVNAGGGVRLFSDPFIVTGPDGLLQVVGAVSEATEGCVVINALDDTRYALSGVTTPVMVGSRITVDGHVAPQDAAPEASTCGGRPAIPVRVARVRGF